MAKKRRSKQDDPSIDNDALMNDAGDTTEETTDETSMEEPATENNDETSVEKKEEVPVVEPPPVVKPEPKKITPMAKPLKTVDAPKTVTADTTPELARLGFLLTRYIELISNKINNDADRKRVISIFVSVMDLVLASNDRAVFEAYYSFYLKNRRQLIAPEQALAGLSKYSDKARISQITAFFTVFATLAESKLMKTTFTLNVSAIRAALKNEELVSWIISKQ